jgi:hypothetical protein
MIETLAIVIRVQMLWDDSIVYIGADGLEKEQELKEVFGENLGT